ncbi:MAG: hypothetical protein GC179_30985 [Anaerolineaceae bacterium]|nr:hypothetical protein [Anaerolineaceae bacterium]
MKKTFLRKILAISVILISACTSAAQTTDLIPVTIQLGTTHQAVYGGFYAADQNGNYAREGLAVDFIEGGPNVDQVAPLMDGTAQFSIMGASAVIAQHAAGKPVIALATILRRDPVVFFSLASSNIVHLKDFVGKKVLATPNVRPRLYAMLAKADIDRSQITLVDSSSFTDLYTGEIDVASGLITSAVLAARRAGHPVNIIYPDDYGVHFYSTTIDATEDYVAAHPDVVTKFLRASFQGWAEVVEDPQSVGTLVSHYNPKADVELESASMVASIPYINTGEDNIGWMKPEVWAGMLRTIRAEDESFPSLDITNVYTMKFIQQIYGDNRS